MEGKVSEVRIDMPIPKETCSICIDDNISAIQMFSVDICGHRFCSECVKRYIEAKLLEGNRLTCPHDGCHLELRYQSCVNLLTDELKKIWKQRIIEELIPVTERVYCPNPRCSALMSVKELSIIKSTEESGVRKLCVKCREPFCINCKVTWHKNISCDNYKILHPNSVANDSKLEALANKNMWRQCTKCQNMIELSEGCATVQCRCGHSFCYRCGANAGCCPHGHNFYDLRTGRLLYRPWCAVLWTLVLLVVTVAGIVASVVFIILHFVRKK
ncbi:unnamed protein product [Brassica napus]|uniref:RBR-type E3 ubiquitin transferase n=1 Tax=Brassica napus TaxID=3708 RepID=A0A816VHF5_BRANA|nr:unnamed protein product [Brassica napus]